MEELNENIPVFGESLRQVKVSQVALGLVGLILH